VYLKRNSEECDNPLIKLATTRPQNLDDLNTELQEYTNSLLDKYTPKRIETLVTIK
jgi:hypothetical protein